MRILVAICVMLFALVPAAGAQTGGDEFEGYKAAFNNFMTCELTRTDATDYFKGQAFKITMVNLHSVTHESGLTILTGAVQCYVKDRYETLYPAIGVEQVLDKDRVTYFIVRREKFSILASELFKYPYSERCPWARYWINLSQ